MKQHKEVDSARNSYRDYMAELITDDKQFGYEVDYQRSTLYERIIDVVGRHALFGLFLAGFRAGRQFEKTSPDAAPRIENLDVNLQKIAARCGAPEEGELTLFSPTLLKSFAERLLLEVSGRSVYVTQKERPAEVTADISTLVEKRLGGIALALTSATKAPAREVSKLKRDALAYHLWVADQTRTHGVVIGKWEDVGERYRGELGRQADALLSVLSAIDAAITPPGVVEAGEAAAGI